MNKLTKKKLLLISLLVPSSMFGMLGRLGQRFSNKVGQRYVNRVVSQRLVLKNKQLIQKNTSNLTKVKQIMNFDEKLETFSKAGPYMATMFHGLSCITYGDILESPFFSYAGTSFFIIGIGGTGFYYPKTIAMLGGYALLKIRDVMRD